MTNTELKGICKACGKYGDKQNKYPKKNKSEEENEDKKCMGKCNHCGNVEHKVQTAGNMRLIKTRDPRIGRRMKKMR